MRLITSKDALDMLTTCAPRAWCKRLLNWEAFWGELNLYARDGVITHRRTAFQILLEAGLVSDVNDVPTKARLAALAKDDDETEAILRAAAAPKFEAVEWHSFHWGVQDGPLPIGLVIAQTSLDWESGELTAEITNGLVPDEWLDTGEGVFTPDRNGEVDAHLTGLSFELSAIEMLVPTAGLPGERTEVLTLRTGLPRAKYASERGRL